MKMINKPTKKELLQIYYLEREIKNIQRIIDNLSDVDIKSPMSAEVIVSPTNNPGNPTATVGVNLADLSERLKRLQQQCQQQRLKILAYIEQIEDSYLRQIVMLRCLNLYTWQEVADAIGGNNTALTCRVAFSRAFK